MEKIFEILSSLSKEAQTIKGLNLSVNMEVSEENFEKFYFYIKNNNQEIKEKDGIGLKINITHNKELDK